MAGRDNQWTNQRATSGHSHPTVNFSLVCPASGRRRARGAPCLILARGTDLHGALTQNGCRQRSRGRQSLVAGALLRAGDTTPSSEYKHREGDEAHARSWGEGGSGRREASRGPAPWRKSPAPLPRGRASCGRGRGLRFLPGGAGAGVRTGAGFSRRAPPAGCPQPLGCPSPPSACTARSPSPRRSVASWQVRLAAGREGRREGWLAGGWAEGGGPAAERGGGGGGCDGLGQPGLAGGPATCAAAPAECSSGGAGRWVPLRGVGGSLSSPQFLSPGYFLPPARCRRSLPRGCRAHPK